MLDEVWPLDLLGLASSVWIGSFGSSPNSKALGVSSHSIDFGAGPSPGAGFGAGFGGGSGAGSGGSGAGSGGGSGAGPTKNSGFRLRTDTSRDSTQGSKQHSWVLDQCQFQRFQTAPSNPGQIAVFDARHSQPDGQCSRQPTQHRSFQPLITQSAQDSRLRPEPRDHVMRYNLVLLYKSICRQGL